MTRLGCGEIYSESFIANCHLILTVKNFENQLIFGEVMRYKKWCHFLAHPVYLKYMYKCNTLSSVKCYINLLQ